MRKSNNLIGLFTASTLSLALLVGCSTTTPQAELPVDPVWDKLVVPLASFDTAQPPSSVVVDNDGRTFISFAYLKSKPDLAVAEILPDGELAAFPSGQWNSWNGDGVGDALRGFVSPTGLQIDDQNRLWILDSGRPLDSRQTVLAGPKLFRISLETNEVEQVFYFDQNHELTRGSYLADFRLDPDGNTVYIADAGTGGIFVYDLNKRQGRRALLSHESTKYEPGILNTIADKDIREHLFRSPDRGVAGIELSNDGQHLLYQARRSRTLYRVPTNVLKNPNFTDGHIANFVEVVDQTPSIIGGLWADENTDTHNTSETTEGDNTTLYMTAVEFSAIHRRLPNGKWETFVASDRLSWPNQIAFSPDGYIYFTTTARHLGRFSHSQLGQIYKVSIYNVERAAMAKKQAQEDHLAIARTAQEAFKARAELARQEGFVRIKQAEQAKLAERAAEAEADAAKVAKHRDQVVTKANVAAQAHATAADAAEHAALLAQREAESAAAAADASAAAFEAAKLAAEAALAQAQNLERAQEKAGLTAEQAAETEKAHQAALAKVNEANNYVNLVEQAAAERSRKAAAAQAEAEQALQQARAARKRADQLAAAAVQSRDNAAAAAIAAKQAENIELLGESTQPETIPVTSTADVPVE